MSVPAEWTKLTFSSTCFRGEINKTLSQASAIFIKTSPTLRYPVPSGIKKKTGSMVYSSPFLRKALSAHWANPRGKLHVHAPPVNAT